MRGHILVFSLLMTFLSSQISFAAEPCNPEAVNALGASGVVEGAAGGYAWLVGKTGEARHMYLSTHGLEKAVAANRATPWERSRNLSTLGAVVFATGVASLAGAAKPGDADGVVCRAVNGTVSKAKSVIGLSDAKASDARSNTSATLQ